MNVFLLIFSLNTFSSSFAQSNQDLLAQGLTQAKHFITEARKNPEVENESGLADILKKIEDSFDWNFHFQEETETCNTRYAWVDPAEARAREGSREVLIHVCTKILKNSSVFVGEIILHEISHFLFYLDEKSATRFEIMTMHFAGASPMWSSFIDKTSGDPQAQYAQGAQVLQGFEYLEKIGIKSKLDYAAWKWAFGMMGTVPIEAIRAAWDKQHRENRFTEAEYEKILNYPNQEGMTCLMLAAREGATEQVRFLLSLPAVQKDLKDQKGRTAKEIAIAYGHPHLAALW